MREDRGKVVVGGKKQGRAKKTGNEQTGRRNGFNLFDAKRLQRNCGKTKPSENLLPKGQSINLDLGGRDTKSKGFRAPGLYSGHMLI